MLLRTRIALMVSVCMLVLATALIAHGNLVEGQIRDRYWKAVDAGDQNAWNGIEQSALRLLDGFFTLLDRDDVFTHGLATGNVEAVAGAIRGLQSTFQASYLDVRVDVAFANGTTAYPQDGRSSGVLGPAFVRKTVAHGSRFRGVIRTPDGHYRLVVAGPVNGRRGTVGVIAFSTPIQGLLDDFARTIGAGIALVSGKRKVAEAGWQNFDPVRALAESRRAKLVRGHDRTFAITRLTLKTLTSRSPLWLLTSRDETRFEARRRLVDLLTYLGLGSGFALFLAFLYWYFRVSFRPLDAVIRVLRALSAGDTSVKGPEVGSHDEIGRLASTVEVFRQAQRDRTQLDAIRQDLSAASSLQQAILPQGGIESPIFTVDAGMKAARDVGGDFYDYFEVGDGCLGMVMADVSGKGMAAALFMAVARTVIRTTATMIDDPGLCLTRANALLSADNDALMFVTTFYGVLDLRTGRLSYANGGHNPPYVLRGGEVTALPSTRGRPLGLFGDSTYADGHIDLEPDDRLFLYTDGITEAFNTKDEEFGTARLEEVLSDMGPEGTLAEVVESVDHFAAGAPQSDDMTCMFVRWIGSGDDSA